MSSNPGYIPASARFSGASLCKETRCHLCKERFSRTSAHAYTRKNRYGHEIYFCKYSCMRAWDKAQEERNEQRKAIETEHRVAAQRKWREEKREKGDGGDAADDA